MALTPEQLPTLKAAINANPTWAAYPMTSDGHYDLAKALNQTASPAFVVWKTTETVAAVGLAVNYVAFEALTATNLEKINTFSRLNMSTFSPAKADIRSFWANVFSGSLGGQGQATRDAFDALWRRSASYFEKIFATGTGTTVAPATLVVDGAVSPGEVQAARELT